MTDQPLSSDLAAAFNAFALRAVADFPELAGEFAVYHAPTATLHGVFNPADRDTLLAIGWKHAQEGVNRTLDAAALHPLSHGEGHTMIEYYQNHFTAALPHELGHLVAPGGSLSEPNFNETVAITFAEMYRQPDYRAVQQQITAARHKASNFILEDRREYFYTPAAAEMEGLAARYDLSRLTPLNMANLAFRVALKSIVAPDDIAALAAFFAPVRDALADPARGLSPALELCANMALADDGRVPPLAVETARDCLSAYMPFTDDGQIQMDERLVAYKPAGFWQDLLAQLYQKSAPLQPPATAEAMAEQEAADLLLFGRFDAAPDKKIEPVDYTTPENMAYLERMRRAYIALRIAPATDGLTPDQVVAKARIWVEPSQPLTPTAPQPF